MSEYLDRYEQFRNNTGTTPIPNIKIPLSTTDKTIVYRLGRTRLDRVSGDYYGNPYHGWLIMLANPQFGGLEFNIPDNTIIRIPFPFKAAVAGYNSEVEKHILINGR